MKTFSLDWNYFSFTQMKKCLHVSKLKWEGDLLLILRVINFSCFSSRIFMELDKMHENIQGVEHDLWRIARIERRAKISVYKHWRHFRSCEQNYCGQIHFDFRQMSILWFPLNFNSEVVSWYYNFPPGVRMKSTCRIHVKRQSFEVREFLVISFVSIAFCQPWILRNSACDVTDIFAIDSRLHQYKVSK